MWRLSEWVTDQSLPPRFGIISLNMSESANSMFEDARHGSWLDTMDFILDKMCNRISQLQKNVKNCCGISPTTRGVLEAR
jgi:hypothetical protein